MLGALTAEVELGALTAEVELGALTAEVELGAQTAEVELGALGESPNPADPPKKPNLCGKPCHFW